MAGDRKVQRVTEFHHLAQLLQVIIDAVQEAVILPPLLARGFCRNDGKEEARAFPPVAVCYLFQHRFPRYGNLLAGEVLAVGELSVPDVFPCQAENVVAPHALGVDREEEDVAGKNNLLRFTAQVQATQAFHFFERQPVPLFLDAVAHVHAFKRIAIGGKAVIDGKFVDPLQIPYVEGNGIASQFLVLQPGVVVAYQQGIEVLEGDFVLAQIGDEFPEIHFQFVRRVIPSLVPQFLNTGVGVGNEAETFQPLSDPSP